MFSHVHQERIRYADTDQMGYVYYGKYATFYEIGRVEALRSLGCSYKSLEEKGLMMPVLEVQSKFLQPAKYDDLISITTSIPELPSMKVRFTHEIHNQEGKLLHQGVTVLVFIRKEDFRPVRFPEEISRLLRPFY